MPAGAAEEIGQLVGGDGKEVRLQVASFVVIRQTVVEADEGLLHYVFGGGAVAQPAVGECQQPAFVALDQTKPGIGVAPADLLDQQPVRIGGHNWLLPLKKDSRFIL